MATQPQAGLVCRDERRRALVRHDPRFNGLDYLEVSDDQLRLTVYFLDKAPELVAENVRITGGRRVTGIRVVEIDICRSEDPERDDCLTITVDRPGDFSCYRLCIVELDERGRGTDRPRHDFDPRYACLDFTFKAGCPTPLDCISPSCPPEIFPEPEINYLAKDYGSFRQLLLDRLALLIPDWRERHVPDLGIALVELLAYVGDHLSYQQDAVGTEAYLDTARLRVSVRRHARLVDYRMHEGCNARAWVAIETNVDRTLPPDGLAFITSVTNLFPLPPGPVVAAAQLERLPTGAYEWFEPVHRSPVDLREAHSSIDIHTWGDTECCLPVGTTRATLVDSVIAPPPDGPAGAGYDESPPPAEPTRRLDLHPGQFVLFEEVIGPKTGGKPDADPTHRHVVRLTAVEPAVDALTGTLVVEVEWAPEDALPFPLCLSSIGPPPECAYLPRVSVARANVVLVDHGRTVDEPLGEVPTVDVQAECADGCPDEPVWVAGLFRPTLGGVPLTFRAPLPHHGSAARLVSQDPRRAEPAVEVHSVSSWSGVPAAAWRVRPDLLPSGPDDRHVVVEIDDDGRGHLRFGDGVLGRAPAAGDVFTARYRVGNGRAGNVGAEAITQLVGKDPLDGAVLKVRNPLPARGGTAPEPVADVKLLAPSAFRRDRQRAVTAGDYAELAQRDTPDVVQRAAADLRWTGSWYEVLVAVDVLGRAEAEPAALNRVRGALERYRRIAHDLRVRPAVSVGLDVSLLVCVAQHHRRGEVLAAVLDRFSNRVLADGTKGLFHPDRLTFGDGIYVSRLVAEAASINGVENAVVTGLRRSGAPDDGALALGVLRLGPYEIARLDNDPSFPDHGILHLTPGGGR